MTWYETFTRVYRDQKGFLTIKLKVPSNQFKEGDGVMAAISLTDRRVKLSNSYHQ